MKRLLLVSLLCSLTSCSSTTSENSFDSSLLSTHDYSEVEDKTINWTDLFNIDSVQYYAYIFSYTCGHCKNIKDIVIDFALRKDNFYFIEYTKDIPIVVDVEVTLNQNDLNNIGILGTPSLLEVYNKMLIMNIAGEKEISKFIAKP